MPKVKPIDLKRIPIFLSSKEIENPFLFINQFYSRETDLVYAKKELKQWFRSALSVKRLLSKNEMVSLVGFKEYLVRLMESAYLIYESDGPEKEHIIVSPEETQYPLDPAFFHDPKDDIARAWHYFPCYLTAKEVVNPFKALRKVFELKTLHEWRTTIDELFSAAITKCDVLSVVQDDKDIWTIFEYLFKLLEATHLVYVRLRSEGMNKSADN